MVRRSQVLLLVGAAVVVSGAVPAAGAPTLRLHIAGESTEVGSTANGAAVTPLVGPAGTLVVRGSGAVNFAPVQNGNGVFFQQTGQQNSNTAFYQFTGAGLGNVFSVDTGEIEFYVKSKYDLAQRTGDASGRRVWFQAYAGTSGLFSMSMETDAGTLLLYFNTGGTSGGSFYIPRAEADTLFGLDRVLRVKLVWDGSQGSLYLNDLLRTQWSYAKATPNWTSGSAFSLGASNPDDGFGGGFFASDEPIDDFRVLGADLTPPVIGNGQPTGTLHYTATETTISVSTDEPATCKYGPASAPYASLPFTFSTTGGSSHSQLVTGLTPASSHTYYVRCLDSSANANLTDYVISFSVGVVDTEPPAAPPGLSATPFSYEAIDLLWGAATDNVGVTGYKIYRGGAFVLTVPGTSFRDTALASNTAYSYRVTAVDAAGLESPPSNPASATTLPAPPLVEWTVEGPGILVTPSGELGTTGVTAELRPTATAHGFRYDVRLRNRTGTDFTHTALRVRLPRAGAATMAQIEELDVPLPAEVYQTWGAPTGGLQGAQYGFTYEVRGNDALLKQVGPAAYQPGVTNNQWGGRTHGIVRIDGKVYLIPEFWERQPRRITVTSTEVILTLFEGSEPLRAGEDAWDRFAVLDSNASIDPMACVIDTHMPRASNTPFFVDCPLTEEADALPSSSTAARAPLRRRFGIAPAKLRGRDAEGEAMLRRYDQWQGVSWEKTYGTPCCGRFFEGEEPDSERTTLFSLFRRAGAFPNNDPGTLRWRDYGDIQWASGMSSNHYDWLRAAFKHYLRTGNRDALRWGMAAARHAATVDHVWASPATPATADFTNQAGLARYETGDHGGSHLPLASHTWGEGLLLAAAITGDPWIRQAALDRAEAVVRMATNSNTCGETRFNTWPLLIAVAAWRETGDGRYFDKAKVIMEAVWQEEQDSGGMGYTTHRCGWGNQNNTQALMSYAVKPVVSFAEAAKARGLGEMLPKYVDFLRRMATWFSTPVPQGVLIPAIPGKPYRTYIYFFCPPGLTCTQPTDTNPMGGDPINNNHLPDLFFWLAQREPTGANPTTGELWGDLARQIFSDGLNHAAHPDPAAIGYLTNMYPGTETKALGWPQLFIDRAAVWLSGGRPLP